VNNLSPSARRAAAERELARVLLPLYVDLAKFARERERVMHSAGPRPDDADRIFIFSLLALAAKVFF